jgi:hypothetical protein
MTNSNTRFILIMTAGLAGGLAEVLWISLYSILSHVDGMEISRQITATVIPGMSVHAMAPVLGLIIHLVLSVLLAYGFCLLLASPMVRYFGRPGLVPGSCMVLVAVWLVNFFIILPMINPSFIETLPLVVTLISKLVFGVAMAIVLLYGLENRAVNTSPA